MQTVADSPYGINIFLLRYCFYLFPDIADMYIQAAVVAGERPAKHLFGKLVLVDDLTGMTTQPLQQVEFCTGEIKELITPKGLALS